jgi:hypothetical protein
LLFLLAAAIPAAAQPQEPMQMNMPEESGWHVMQDGVVFGMFNHQGGPRGGDEFRVPNWWMGMFSRKVRSAQLTINTMFSLDPATVGEKGYREIFQAGESFDGKPLIDRQHPHDFFMQLAGVWRVPVTDRTGLTIAGGPAGEPAIGPVAFMHRASAAENPIAPLSHHVFDSTHIAFGIVTAAVDHGPWLIEGSLFNGREPDQHRWDFDFGAMDSVAGRVWYRPAQEWELQFSSARLKEPEELEHGNILRTTLSAGWLRKHEGDFSAVTVGFGRNDKEEGDQNSVFAEGTRHAGRNSIFGRFELHQAERVPLETGFPAHDLGLTDTVATIAAFTAGGVRDIVRWQGFEGGLGTAITLYRSPAALKKTHGAHPVSFQVFFRVRPPAGSMGRMWNMRMSQPMAPMPAMAPMADPHAGHHMN